MHQPGASLHFDDLPLRIERAQGVLPPSETMRYAASPYEAAEGADAVLILTDWAEFSKLDLQRLKEAMQHVLMALHVAYCLSRDASR